MFSEPQPSALSVADISLDCRASYAIRRAERMDLNAIYQLECESFDPALAFNRRQIQTLLNNPRADFWLLTAAHGLVAQLLTLRRRQGQKQLARIYSLTVAEDFRGRGLARQLLAWGLRDLRQQFIPRVILEVEASSIAPVRLYESFGFQHEKQLLDYYGTGRHGIKMALDLKGVQNFIR